MIRLLIADDHQMVVAAMGDLDGVRCEAAAEVVARSLMAGAASRHGDSHSKVWSDGTKTGPRMGPLGLARLSIRRSEVAKRPRWAKLRTDPSTPNCGNNGVHAYRCRDQPTGRILIPAL